MDVLRSTRARAVNRIRARLAVAVVAAGLVTFGLPSSVLADTFHPEKPAHSLKCLDVPGNNWYYGAPVQQYECNGGQNQQWTIYQWYDGAVSICGGPDPGSADYCIGRDGDGSNGDSAVLRYRGWFDDERWLDQRPSPYFDIFHNLVDGRCLDIEGWSQANGARAQVYDCTGGDNQKFIWL